MTHRIHATTACRPDLAHHDAMTALADGIDDPLLGRCSIEHVQLCPQNHGVLSAETLAALQRRFPHTRFRFHANVRIDGPSRHRQDASRVDADSLTYYRALGSLCESLATPAYTLHAGLRAHCSRERLHAHHAILQSLFPCPVGIEPLYPAPGSPFLLDSWDDLRWLADSGLPFALDLAHLHIIATRSRHYDDTLTYTLLTHPLCLEIHLSHNDGRHDRHTPLATPPWWWQAWLSARSHPHCAPAFYEGNHAHDRRLAPPPSPTPGASPCVTSQEISGTTTPPAGGSPSRPTDPFAATERR